MLRRRVVQLLILLSLPAAIASCIVNYSNGVKATAVDTKRLPVEVRSPVKAHLTDGSTIIYPKGISVQNNSIGPRGDARRYGPQLQAMSKTTITVDSVIGIETYQNQTNFGASLILSTLGNTAAFLGSVVGAVIIFGSCPTVYADSAGTPVLQAEIFATRISPLLEARDIDLLSVRPDSTGAVTLDVRNEALETHYINHLELIEIRHGRNQSLIPDEHGRPLVIGELEPVHSAHDRVGRDLRDMLRRKDGNVFSTDSGTLARATGDDPYDYVDFAMPSPTSDSVVVAMHLRNSLLNTVLLYDMMLAGPGARSLDWISQDMRRIGPVLQFGRWYREHFGLRLSVWDGKKYREIERHPTYGPVAWRDVATVVPVLERDSVRVRLTFMADEWRVDQLSVAPEFTRPKTRLIPVGSVRTKNDSISAVTRRNLRSADERYVQTGPGERFGVVFETGAEPKDATRTFLLASQGYYSEWLRGSWITQPADTAMFAPSSVTLTRTLRRWSAQRDTFPKAFFSVKVPMQGQKP